MSEPMLESAAAEALASLAEMPRRPREQRAAPRVACRIAVRAGWGGETRDSVLTDLSAGGTALAWASPIDLGEVLSLSFALPDGTDVACVGLVRSTRTSPEGRTIGLEFHNLPPAERRAVATWVRERLEGAAPSVHQRPRWGGADQGEAARVPDEERARPALRWAPGFAGLYRGVVSALLDSEMIFVPTDDMDFAEGSRLTLELVPPGSHLVLRLLSEVVWVALPGGLSAEPGLGLKLAGLSPLDRSLMEASLRWFTDEAERYR